MVKSGEAGPPAAFDLMAYALIYWNLETRVAHWIFR
jgi:hypothetical protein